MKTRITQTLLFAFWLQSDLAVLAIMAAHYSASALSTQMMSLWFVAIQMKFLE
jgi:hypothetical protein